MKKYLKRIRRDVGQREAGVMVRVYPIKHRKPCHLCNVSRSYGYFRIDTIVFLSKFVECWGHLFFLISFAPRLLNQHNDVLLFSYYRKSLLSVWRVWVDCRISFFGRKSKR